MPFFTNPWVIGIGSGIIGSFISALIFLRRERTAYIQKIETANNEIIFTIRLSMNANEFPSSDKINSLINSTALKYNIKRKSFYSFSTLADLFIKEIMDNPLISSQKRDELYKLIEKEKKNKETPNKKKKPRLLSPEIAHELLSPLPSSSLFSDNFNKFIEWYNYGKGIVIQSNDIAHNGNFSLKKDSNSDPNGGFKKLKKRTGLGIVFSGWIYRPSKSAGGLGDRLAIEDSNFNGYGFCIAHNNNLVWIERRDRGKPSIISDKKNYIALKDKWYRFEFYLKEKGEFNLIIFDEMGGGAVDLNGRDFIYNTFDQVSVHGGFPYYIDNLKVDRIKVI